ncbi:MAG: hypothetical protein ILP24_06310 [Paludibacteraceae bacterium]|nr:hypothetical protein [Paludibacteraceae bacterium]
MAEKKIVTSEAAKAERKPGVAAQQIAKSTTGLRIGAFVLWIVALVCEFLALKAILAPEDDPFIPGVQPLYAGIGFLVVDLICVICGSLLWKKANHIHPASEKNALTFWLWNNLGVIMAAVAFIPFVILLLTNKDADQKTKTIGTVVAAIAFAIAGLGSYDWNPYSAEEQQEILQMEEATSTVFWVEGGKVFHIYNDCQHLNYSTSEILHETTVQEAEEAGKERLCKTCRKRHEAEPAAVEENANSLIETVAESAGEAAETVKDELESSEE